MQEWGSLFLQSMNQKLKAFMDALRLDGFGWRSKPGARTRDTWAYWFARGWRRWTMKELTGRTSRGATSETKPPLPPWTHPPPLIPGIPLDRRTKHTDRPAVTATPSCMSWEGRSMQAAESGGFLKPRINDFSSVCMCVPCWSGSCRPLEERKINTHPLLPVLGRLRWWALRGGIPARVLSSASSIRWCFDFNPPPKKSPTEDHLQKQSHPSGLQRAKHNDGPHPFSYQLWNCEVFEGPDITIENFLQFPAEPSGSVLSGAQQLCSPSGCRTMEERDRSPAGESITARYTLGCLKPGVYSRI